MVAATDPHLLRIAVLGATGFVGRHVVHRLLDDGCRVHALARRTPEAAHPALTAQSLDVVAATESDLATALVGCDAVVNLVGIKREAGAQTFGAVHVRLAEKLVAAARTAGVRRLVHVSVVVARPDPASGYHDTKWRAERIVEAGGVPWTILRPGVIYGPGDDMLSHLVMMIRAAPVFPVVGRGASLLQPVAVEDVAAAVAAALARPRAVGRTYDVVGPAPMPLREIVRTVAEALELPLRIIPTPPALMRPAVRAMPWVMANPLSTPAQLRMLEDGMTGDPAPAERELGVRPRAFTAAAIRDTVRACPRRLPFDLRFGRPWPGETSGHALRIAALAIVSLVAMTWAFHRGLSGAYRDVVVATAALGVLGAAATGVNRRSLARPDRFGVSAGALAGFALYGVAWALTRWEPAAAQAGELYALTSGRSVPFLLATVPIAVIGEELFWRAGLARLLAGRLPSWLAIAGAALLCALAHAASGTWLLPLAAGGASLAWGTLFIATRGLAAPLASHLVFDALALVFCPLV